MKITRVLTDRAIGTPLVRETRARGKAFTDRLSGLRKRAASGQHEVNTLCADLGIEHRLAQPMHPQTTDEIEQPLSSEMCYFLSLRATAWQRAEREVQAPPRSRISVAPRLRRPHLVSGCTVANAA
jgi:hypothetical protein